MDDKKGVVLPYRTTGEELTRFVEARARGRDLAQIQSLNFAAGNFQGSLVAAHELGFLDADTKDLTPLGREYALAAPERRRALLAEAVLAFEPYERLLEAVFDRGNRNETTLEWVQTWWSTQGYGNSQTNREEGSSAFARLLEFIGLGSYVQGRRGHPTRIQWHEDTPARVRRTSHAAPAPSVAPAAAVAPMPASSREPGPPARPVAAPPSASAPADGPAEIETGPDHLPVANSTLVLNLGPNRTAELSLPPRVTYAEKERLISILELMIDLTPQPGNGTDPRRRS